VNSFEVISIDGARQPPGTIQDTIWIQKKSQVVIRMRFRQWTGRPFTIATSCPTKTPG
jgi:FtsP/CotA-like multicopper oxidase with cupredoxin domain